MSKIDVDDRGNEILPKNCPAELRADFMRRWFAIAVSVGFATTITRMDWLMHGAQPTDIDKEQFARLAVALVATLFSWEGYLLSIGKKPLHDIWRFVLDVTLVFVYLVLLLTSSLPNYWLWLHAVTFFIYILWDILTALQYPQKYAPADESRGWSLQRVILVPRLYWTGLWGRTGFDRGPIITILWAIYFFWVYDLYPVHTLTATYVFAGLIFLGLVGYRVDKGYLRKFAIATPVLVLVAGLVAYVAHKLV